MEESNMERIHDTAIDHDIADMSQYNVKKTDSVKYFVKPKVSARITFKDKETMEKYLETHSNFDKKKYMEVNEMRNLFRLYINFRQMSRESAIKIEKSIIEEMEKL